MSLILLFHVDAVIWQIKQIFTPVFSVSSLPVFSLVFYSFLTIMLYKKIIPTYSYYSQDVTVVVLLFISLPITFSRLFMHHRFVIIYRQGLNHFLK